MGIFVSTLFCIEKNDITQYFYPSMGEPLEISDEEFSSKKVYCLEFLLNYSFFFFWLFVVFVMYLKHRLKRKLLTDIALQQQGIFTFN
jgi:hypothetical protein